jgi:hypothetical protein
VRNGSLKESWVDRGLKPCATTIDMVRFLRLTGAPINRLADETGKWRRETA